MKAADVSYLSEMLRRRAGLSIANTKSRLIETRLAPVMRRFGFKDAGALVAELRNGHDALARAVTEAMTINESSFFRDRAGFARFQETILPDILRHRERTRRLRIWCAACASGQEAYSIAMILQDMKLRAGGWTIDIVATDISSEMIPRAEQGLYSHFEVQRGLPIRRLVENFTQEGAGWRIGESLRRMVTFRQFNLLDSYGWLEDIDAVFCCNVLIYFDNKTKAGVLDRMAEVLGPDGYLILGPVETANGHSSEFVPAKDMPGVFVKARRVPLRAAV
jgi:chemotaxis protein methyltransferase CheR